MVSKRNVRVFRVNVEALMTQGIEVLANGEFAQKLEFQVPIGDPLINVTVNSYVHDRIDKYDHDAIVDKLNAIADRELVFAIIKKQLSF